MFSLLTLVQDEAQRGWVMRLLNISSYAMVPWIVLGFAGQFIFFLRMAVQWISTERERRSVVPTAFWWLSIGGGVMLLAYFIWRKDIVGVMGQSTGILIYARNLWFIHKVTPSAEAARPSIGACPACGAPSCAAGQGR